MIAGAATILWLRRDLRLADHPALTAAVARGGPVIAVFTHDPSTEAEGGAASRWRLARGLERFEQELRRIGGRLILRRGAAASALPALAAETGAGAMFHSRVWDAPGMAREAETVAALAARGVTARGFAGGLLFEPGRIVAKSGGPFKVYTPFSRAALAAPPPPEPERAPSLWPAPEVWPASDGLRALGLDRGMARGAAVLADHARIGEPAARARLERFLTDKLAGYAARRDRMDLDGGSGLSEHLAMGEIGPRMVWHAAALAMERAPEAVAGGAMFLRELLWREFAWSLLRHWPDLGARNWRREWDAFPWRGDTPDAERWRRGRTGQPLVDAAMRELYVTGRMHNRARMITASYLTKHLLTDWRIGEAWFRDCLTDWDPASNAMGWQWTAGSGPDAAPYFRVFNPETQAAKFDPEGAYVARWLPERAETGLLAAPPHPDGPRFFDACPKSWRLSAADAYPAPVVSLAEGRRRALEAYGRLAATR